MVNNECLLLLLNKPATKLEVVAFVGPESAGEKWDRTFCFSLNDAPLQKEKKLKVKVSPPCPQQVSVTSLFSWLAAPRKLQEMSSREKSQYPNGLVVLLLQGSLGERAHRRW